MFKESEEGSRVTVGHVALRGDDYHSAVVIVCFCILLGWRSLVNRLVPMLDYRNDRDGLLEYLISEMTPDRGAKPVRCLRHLPYSKSLTIFKANADDRPKLMAD